MGLEGVVDALEHVEALVADEQTGPVQDSLSWQQTDADVQLGKACAMLGTCRQLRHGTNNYVSIVELSFNAIERSFQFYLVDQTATESFDLAKLAHDELPERVTVGSYSTSSSVTYRNTCFGG